MFLNEEEQKNFSKKNSSTILKCKKRKRYSKINKYPLKKAKYYNEDNLEERISFIEHKNILDEYKEEIEFLRKKRKKPISFENCINYIEKPNNNSNIIICVDNTKIDKKLKNKNDNKIPKEKKKVKNYKNENIKISKLYNLHQHLFVKSGLDSTKLSRFIDYLSSELANGNEFNSSKKEKINFEDIKKLILNLGNKNIENTLVDNLIKEYYHSSFNHSIMEKFTKKINEIIINQNKFNIEIKNKDCNSINDNNSISFGFESSEKNSKTKKDKNSYSYILDEKLTNNNYDSCLSLTNDLDYFKSIIYLNNKYQINNNKNNLLDKTIIKSLEMNRDLLKSFREEKKETANQNDANYLNNLLKNQNLKKYFNKKLNFFNQCFYNNNILKIIDKNNFNEIINLLINDNKEDKKKLKILNKNLSENLKKDDISNFLILLCFIACLTIINKNPNRISESDLSILNPIFQYIHQFDNYSNIKLKNKKKKRMKTINGKNRNKIKINLDNIDIKESLNDNSTKAEERKIEEENKEDKSQINKKILNNYISIYNGNKEINNDKKMTNNNSYINEYFSLKLPNQNDNNNKNIYRSYDIQHDKIKIKCFNKNDLIDDLIDKNLNNNETVKNKNEIKYKNQNNNNLSIFHKKLLRELSLGNDIFKLKYEKLREKKNKNIDSNINKENKDEQKEEKYNEVNIEINEENVKIKNENNINSNYNDFNNIDNKILKKVGNKIIIYSDDFSEENKNYSHNNN